MGKIDFSKESRDDDLYGQSYDGKKVDLVEHVDLVEYVDLNEPLRLGTADVIYSGDDGMIVRERSIDAILVRMEDVKRFQDIYEKEGLNRFSQFSVKEKAIAQLLKNEYGKNFMFSCYQAVYLHKNPPEIPDNGEGVSAVIRPLHLNEALKVQRAYSAQEELSHIEERIRSGFIWGIFERDELAGFIGIHEEGSMGLLEVLPSYRRKGYGIRLEAFLIRQFLEWGRLPYAQVVVGNEVSLTLQKKLGMTLSKGLTYWFF